VGSAEHYLGEVMLATDRPNQAEAYFRDAMNRSKQANEPAWRTAPAASGLGAARARVVLFYTERAQRARLQALLTRRTCERR